ncbi:MAG: hypothetical protein AAFS11_01395 [Planctomycetota bacterium]
MAKALIAAAVAAAGCASAQTDVLIDLGSSGTQTGSPDAFGSTWNNFSPGGFVNLVDTAGNGTGIDFFATSGVTPGSNGALTTPSQALLGNIAVASATGDYVFTTGAAIEFTLDNLDPTKTYSFDLFGTRATDGTRITTYTVDAGNGQFVQDLQTSGIGIGADGVYNGNDDAFASFSGLTADANGQITLDVTVATGGFAYLGAIRVTVVPAAPTAVVFGLSGLVAARRRR